MPGFEISKAFIEMPGGKIGMKSEIGKGSEFYFILPYSPV
jgi:signal transduction histidine kinase